MTADDFSVRGGHADGGIQVKAHYAEVGSYLPLYVLSLIRWAHRILRGEPECHWYISLKPSYTALGLP